MIPGSGRSAGEANGYPLQDSGLENSMDLQRVGHNKETFTFTGNEKVIELENRRVDARVKEG